MSPYQQSQVNAKLFTREQANDTADLCHELDRLREELSAMREQRDALLAACRIGLASTIAYAGRAEARGEMIISLQAAMHAESIRAAIARCS